ncbi:MAG: DNA translocase FtsK [Candidatus Omnitrophota bacterium]|jgi:S-DNA-T family DNA segregation ATPase FtsK/SpoIIIE|nr:MAG: DNA translocase FtsK [Candidatus Omnitrophota bacterium]
MRERRLNEIKAVILIALGLIILASLVSFTPYDLSFYTSHPNVPAKNLIRGFGAYLAGVLLFLFGWASYAIPAITLLLGVKLFRQDIPDLRMPKILGMIVLLLSISSLIGLFVAKNVVYAFSRGGFIGYGISSFVGTYLGKLGASIAFTTLIILSLVLVTDILPSSIISTLSKGFTSLFSSFYSRFNAAKKDKSIKIKPAANIRDNVGLTSNLKVRPQPSLLQETKKDSIQQKTEEAFVKPNIKIKTPVKSQGQSEIKPKPQELKIGDYHLPELDLLESPPPFEARQIKEDLANNAQVLEETLDDFGITVKVTDIERGPVITRYELEPAPGVKLNRIVALGDDIALAMKAQSVRIIAPIPGKARVGVEVPNSKSSLVYLKEVLSSSEFVNAKSKLTLALGKDITGQSVFAELDDMPHLLIAGTTGSGKTVCVNSLILSLLFKSSPVELKFLMIDPKMVELAPFNGIPHLLCPVVTESKKAHLALDWVVNEMEERYKLLAKVGARNIEAYNQKEERIPYIVVIIDEFADLMSVSRDKVENAVTRLAQLSRAVGIHLILATQRPSVDVITGVIKANLPARISFKVASKVDSRTVLDMNGADKLLGKGDMLFLRPGESKLIRVQGTLVNDKEIEKVVDFIKEQGQPVYDDEILREKQRTGMVNGDKDELYDEAVRIIMESNQASVSILQRRLRLGYTRAARIIDIMEQDGLVGPYEGSKPRKILVDRNSWLEKYLTVQENDQQ